PATSNQRKLGFTLSELLVSLGVLGLIAGLTVPSIVNSVDRSKNRSILKESVQIISAITQAGVLNGDFASITDWNLTTSTNPKGIVGYITSKLNYSKQCLTTDITSEGCKRGWAGQPANSSNNANNARWILPNGSKIQAHGAGGQNQWPYDGFIMGWTITTKPYANDMTVSGTNPDTFILVCNISDTTQVHARWPSVKAGMCGGHDNELYRDALNVGLGLT
ncbi:MAG: prepilin-type N-terminal cleavage/methylation domain-containing protein, partial [Candidatus Melainabacteria bacterium]|nr:prepilin-type N-terminal cleavage/methylation domain-containing protein [Candidatus Melainabacteria bacterium]